MPERLIGRRDFVRTSVGTLGALAAAASLTRPAGAAPAPDAPRPADPVFTGEELDQVAFPLGGFGAGMLCLEGSGGLTNVSVRDRPLVQNEPGLFAAISVGGPGKIARVVEGPVPRWKLYERRHAAAGNGPLGLGLPRFGQATFRAHFPFARVELSDPTVPLIVRLTGWSPFEPGDADASSLPVAALEYTFGNTSVETLDAVFSFNAHNFLPAKINTWESGPETERSTRATPGGFIHYGGAWPQAEQEEAWCACAVDDPAVKVNLAWFRGGWFDPQTMVWRDVEQAAAYDRPVPAEGEPPTGASLYVPFQLGPNEAKTIRLRLAWFAPRSRLRGIVPPVKGPGQPADFYQPWYGGRFRSIDEVAAYWADNYAALRRRSERFSDCFFDTNLPSEAVEGAAANLSILKSSTVLRQADGRLWGWEGCEEDHAQGEGTCTHVWNYAQSIPHLFPSLERTLRETEFTVGQDSRGHQNFRVALPIQPSDHDYYAAADGQLGGIMKVHREWRISGDTGWLRGLWPLVRRSMDYGIATWDPGHQGWPVEPQHNTYDIQFWGPNGMIGSFYIGALTAMVAMGKALGDDVSLYEDLRGRGAARIDAELFNGEFYVQRVEWRDLQTKVKDKGTFFGEGYSSEARALLEKEGPKYQYGPGCLSDGVFGSGLALACGVGQILDPDKVRSHLQAVHRHNLRRDLADHANPQRATYANGHDGGLLLCSWPRGGMPSLPFVYSNEVWTGIEYQAASHMIAMGLVTEGLEVVRACRARYDGRTRNPFDEYEWGHWYARAMASYGLLQALSGARYDAVDGVLHLAPALHGDFRSFLSTATGYGTVGVTDGKPFLKVVSGTIPYKEIRYTAASKAGAERA
jgi:uncharacterized protein (DUF608 family)